MSIAVSSVYISSAACCNQNLVLVKLQSLYSVFSWEAFCQDTSIEKAGLYSRPAVQNMPGSPDRSLDLNEENCLKSFALDNIQAVSSPKLHGLEPPLRSQRLATWYNLFYFELNHSFFLFFLLLQFHFVYDFDF